MIGFVTKLGLAGGAISGVLLINTNNANFDAIRREKKIDELDNKNFEKIEDIELYENTYGCSFVYVAAWDTRVLYSAREIVEKNKSTDEFMSKVINGANGAKQACKRNKGLITLVNNDGWKQQAPRGGW